jgi:large subunit ribosomal protein L7A
MDTQKYGLTEDSTVLKDLMNQRVVVGAKQLRKALSRGDARRVYLASNADPALTEPLEALCQHYGVAYTWVKSMEDLGRACGIEVGAATATVVG